MWCRYLLAGSHGDSNVGKVPEFDDWIETKAWHTVEGQFIGIGVLPSIVVAGCAPPAIGTAAARATAVRASSTQGREGAVVDGAWLTWVFCCEGTGNDGNQVTIPRSKLEELQRTYSPAAVGRQVAANALSTHFQSGHSSGPDSSLPQRSLWNEAKVAAFSIECREQVRPQNVFSPPLRRGISSRTYQHLVKGILHVNCTFDNCVRTVVCMLCLLAGSW